MIARNALAPVFFFRACSAMASNAPSSNSNLTSSSSNNFTLTKFLTTSTIFYKKTSNPCLYLSYFYKEHY